MPDQSILDTKDEFGKSARDYAAVNATLNEDVRKFMEKRAQQLTDYNLVQFGDVKSYGDAVVLTRTVVEAVVTQLLSEDFLMVGPRGLNSQEDIDAAVAKWNERVGSRFGAALQPTEPSLFPAQPGQYL